VRCCAALWPSEAMLPEPSAWFRLEIKWVSTSEKPWCLPTATQVLKYFLYVARCPFSFEIIRSAKALRFCSSDYVQMMLTLWAQETRIIKRTNPLAGLAVWELNLPTYLTDSHSATCDWALFHRKSLARFRLAAQARVTFLAHFWRDDTNPVISVIACGE